MVLSSGEVALMIHGFSFRKTFNLSKSVPQLSHEEI
jgi:hypothetical protein